MRFNRRQDRTATPFKDFTLLFAMGFFVIVVLALEWINPKAEETNMEPPGNLIVTITWDLGDIDVDLWVKCPVDKIPVGYSNKSGKTCNLLRDDRGNVGDITTLNYENLYTRGVVPGEYVLNVHCFKCAGPVRVKMEVAVNTGRGTRTLMTTGATLRGWGDERTVVRFVLNKDGSLQRDSVNSVQRKLRSEFADGLDGSPTR